MFPHQNSVSISYHAHTSYISSPL